MKEFPQMNRAEKEKEITEALKVGVDELVIHGEKIKNKEGEEFLALRPDLDSRASIYLLGLAGVNYNKLTFVPKGEWVPGKINIDTGERPAFDIEEDGSVFFDHHGKEKVDWENATSATKIIYEILIKHGLLKREEWLDTLVKFVTDIDNADYPLDEDYFKNEWWRSLYGLQKAISFESLVNLIKDGKDPRKPFTKEVAESAIVEMANKKEAPLFNVCLNQQRMVDNSVRGVKEARDKMDDLGIEGSQNKLLGKTVLNIIKVSEVDGKGKEVKNKNHIPLGFTAARALGYDSYFLWDEKNGGFFLTSKFDMQKIFDIISPLSPGAKIIRGTMIINQGEEVPPGENRVFSPEILLQALQLKA